MPEIVPPVPMPATKWVTLPVGLPPDLRAGPVIVRGGVVGVRVLVGLPAVLGLPGEAAGDAVVGVRMLGRHARGAHDDLGAVGAEHGDLVGGHLVRAGEHAPVAALLGDDRQADARVARGRLDDHAAFGGACPAAPRSPPSAGRCGPSPSRPDSGTRSSRARRSSSRCPSSPTSAEAGACSPSPRSASRTPPRGPLVSPGGRPPVPPCAMPRHRNGSIAPGRYCDLRTGWHDAIGRDHCSGLAVHGHCVLLPDVLMGPGSRQGEECPC